MPKSLLQQQGARSAQTAEEEDNDTFEAAYVTQVQTSERRPLLTRVGCLTPVLHAGLTGVSEVLHSDILCSRVTIPSSNIQHALFAWDQQLLFLGDEKCIPGNSIPLYGSAAPVIALGASMR